MNDKQGATDPKIGTGGYSHPRTEAHRTAPDAVPGRKDYEIDRWVAGHDYGGAAGSPPPELDDKNGRSTTKGGEQDL